MNFQPWTLDDYQEQCKTTAVFDHSEVVPGWLYCAVGLGDEAGEILGKVKKIIRDDGGVITEEKRAAIKKELGDVLWYLSMTADQFGLRMSEVAAANVEKLQSRKERGTLHGSGDDR